MKKNQKFDVMIKIKVFNAVNQPSTIEKETLIDFLFVNLEQYGDPKQDIEKAINYALKEIPSFGGFVLAAYQDGKLVGEVVVNETGMSGYIPENILVYIATHKDYRGKGIGKLLLSKTIENTKGDIALHVEPDNPARYLYEKMGFTSKYIEMRLKK
jgi:GNAT superfamily N-acetyltransferase